jgi:hypothetical protein
MSAPPHKPALRLSPGSEPAPLHHKLSIATAGELRVVRYQDKGCLLCTLKLKHQVNDLCTRHLIQTAGGLIGK